jgi:hypothetical protein
MPILEVEGFKVKGILQAVTVQQGTTARGAWTAHHCHVDGQKYTTFDKKIGADAVASKTSPCRSSLSGQPREMACCR